MARANLHDRASIERVYPADSFAADAVRNDVPGAARYGVRITSAPDPAGDFELEPAARHVGETAGTVFLAPYRRVEELVERGVSGGPRQASPPAPAVGYRRFIDEVIAAAIRLQGESECTPVADDAVLRGPRQ